MTKLALLTALAILQCISVISGIYFSTHLVKLYLNAYPYVMPMLPWMAGRSIAMLVSPQPWIIPIISLSSRLDF